MNYSAKQMSAIQSRLIKKIKKQIKNHNGYMRKEFGSDCRASDKSFWCGVHFDKAVLSFDRYNTSFRVKWHKNGTISISTSTYQAPELDMRQLSFVDLAMIAEKMKFQS